MAKLEFKVSWLILPPLRFCRSPILPWFETSSTMSTTHSPADPPKKPSLDSLDSNLNFVQHLHLFWGTPKTSACLGPSSSPCLKMSEPTQPSSNSSIALDVGLSLHMFSWSYLLLESLTSNCELFNKSTSAYPLFFIRHI